LGFVNPSDKHIIDWVSFIIPKMVEHRYHGNQQLVEAKQTVPGEDRMGRGSTKPVSVGMC
jgi:hypothetical protein